MNIGDFLEILQDATKLRNDHVLGLEDILEEFPFFQAARVLHLKGLKNQNSFRYNKNLKATAIYTSNRSVLFNFITSDSFQTPISTQQEEKIIQDITLIDATVIDKLHKRIAIDTHTEKTLIQKIKVKRDSARTESDNILGKTQGTTILSKKREREQKKYDENKQNIDQTVSFDRDDTYSFNEWMQLSTFKPIDRSMTHSSDSEKQKRDLLIDEFITKNPKIKPIKKSEELTPLTFDDEGEEDMVMTETLAYLYIKQQKYEEAINAFEILSLRFPEKSGFFADQINLVEKIKEGN